MTVILAVSYGGREEMRARGARHPRGASGRGELSPERITAAARQALGTRGIPDPTS